MNPRRLAAWVFVLAALGWVVWIAFWPREIAPPRTLMLPKGADAHAIGRMLAHAGVVPSAAGFVWTARMFGLAEHLQAGEYRFAGRMSTLDVARKIAQGKVVLHRITIPEGLTTAEMLRLLAAKTGISLARWQAALKALFPHEDPEGRFLPETYTYARPLDPKHLLATMAHAQDALLDRLVGADAKRRRVVRIVASIVEKETALARERPIVASVIYNRLARGMRLEMDPTVIYGIIRTRGRFDGNLRRRDLTTDTPWNTYTRKGLPPTPICNPGRASLRAAAHPAHTDYLYFVANGTGGHAFARTYEEHERNVRRWIAIERARRR